MISTVSCAASRLRSTQNTCAPSRAKVTAVALPLPQPGPIEPAPTTIAVLPLSRGIEVSFPSCSPDEPLRYPGPSLCGFPDAARAHPGYGQALIVVTFDPIGKPKISDSVRHLPPVHNRHSPAAPELPSATSGIAARCGCH